MIFFQFVLIRTLTTINDVYLSHELNFLFAHRDQVESHSEANFEWLHASSL
jgi:hypothetical protein